MRLGPILLVQLRRQLGASEKRKRYQHTVDLTIMNYTHNVHPYIIDDYIEARRNGMTLVDKTYLIEKILLDRGTKSLLFTRPYGFGKTMNLTMLDAFFNPEYNRNTWFDGTYIAGEDGVQQVPQQRSGDQTRHEGDRSRIRCRRRKPHASGIRPSLQIQVLAILRTDHRLEAQTTGVCDKRQGRNTWWPFSAG